MGKYTAYPDRIDTSTEIPVQTDLVSPVKSEIVNRIRDAVIAIEAELGTEPSGTYGTVKDRLDAMDAGGVGGGGAIKILKNDISVNTQVTEISFAGDVTIETTQPHRVTVSVGTSVQKQEYVTVTSDAQTVFTLSDAPIQSNAVFMFVNGLKQKYGSDYTVSGSTVNYVGSPSLNTSDVVEFWYLESLSGIVSSKFFSVTPIQTSDYQAVTGDAVRCDPSGGAFSVTLPDASINLNAVVLVKNITDSTNAITVDTLSSQTIDGQSSVTVDVARESYAFLSDGSNWITIIEPSSSSSPVPTMIPIAGVAGLHQTAQTGIGQEIGAIVLDPSVFGTPAGMLRTIKFVAVLEAAVGGQTCSLELYNLTDGASVTTLSTVQTGATIVTSAALVVPTDLPNSQKLYVLRLQRTGGTVSDLVTCKLARIEIVYTEI